MIQQQNNPSPPIVLEQNKSRQKERDQLVAITLQIKRCFANNNSSNLQQNFTKIMNLIQQLKLIQRSIWWVAQQFVRVYFHLIYGKFDQRIQINELDKQICTYCTQNMVINLDLPENQLSYKNQLQSGQKLLYQMISNEIQSSFIRQKVIKLILYNNSICYHKLKMQQQSLNCIQRLQKLLNSQDQYFLRAKEQIKLRVQLSMGIKLSKTTTVKQLKDSQQQYISQNIFTEFQQIIQMEKHEISQFINFYVLNQCKIHINNWYNLCLLCKNYGMKLQAKQLLISMISCSKVQQMKILHLKCLILLSKICQEDKDLQNARQYLEMHKIDEQSLIKQINLKIWELKKRIDLINSAKTSRSPQLVLNKSNKYQLMLNLQRQLLTLTKNKESQKLSKNHKNLHITMYKHKNVKAFQTKKQYKTLISQSKKSLKQSVLIHIQPKKSIDQFNGGFSNKTPLKSKKIVKIYQQGQSSNCKIIISKISDYEEKIMTLIIEEKFQQIVEEIQDLEDHIERWEKIYPFEIKNFTIKLVNWCRTIGKSRYAIVFLKKVVSRFITYGKDQYSKQLLQLLSRSYEELTDYKNAIDIHLQLFKMGEIESLDKVGEMYTIRQNYSESLKYYEKYYQLKKTLYSTVKLAYTYSKIPSYTKKAIDILNDILFENKSNCTFKKYDASEIENVQNALLLLTNIYMNMNGIKKATEICEKFLDQNFGAYPIFFILGVMMMREGKDERAFNCFLNAIRLKPNHLPSLIEIVKYIGVQHHKNSIIQILRKSFLTNHRNWDLLKLLVEVLEGKPTILDLNITNIIYCAKVLENSNIQNNLNIEAESVWLWAMEMMQERRKRLSIVDHEFAETIYIRLGEINLSKGNYPASESYFKRILQMIQLSKMKIKSKSRLSTFKLELEIKRRLAFIKSKQRDINQSIKYLQQCIELSTTNQAFIQALADIQKLGDIYTTLEDYPSALNQFSKIIEEIKHKQIRQHKDQEAINDQLGRWIRIMLKISQCYTKTKQWRQAKRIYQQIISRQMNVVAIERLGHIYELQGNIDRAVELFQCLKTIKQQEQLIKGKVN